MSLPDYAELHALSNFSFQRGASHPHELVQRAHDLGYAALALTDECSVAGMVRAHVAARQLGLRLIAGSEFLWGDLRIVALARDARAWGDLCEFISAARARAPKGSYVVDAQSPWALLRGCELLLAPRREAFVDASDSIAVSACLESAKAHFDHECWLAVELHMAQGDALCDFRYRKNRPVTQSWDSEIAAIRVQIATADLRRQAHKQALDAEWFHRAKTALRMKREEAARLSARLIELTPKALSSRASSRERFKDALIEAMRAECDDARWAALLQRARLLHDHQEVSHG